MRALIKFTGLLSIIIIISLTPELVGGDLADTLKAKLGDYYHHVITVAGFISILIYTLWSDGDKIFKKVKTSTVSKEVRKNNLEKIRKSLLKVYQQRLHSKLAGRYPLNIQLKYSTEGATIKKPIYDNRTIRSNKIQEEIIQVFDAHQGRLLITGKPGAGKTSLLLKLAIEIIEKEKFQIPIVINMASWRYRFASVENWILELLPQMGFSKTLVQQLLNEKRFLLFFDGLDELAEENRKDCLEAIGRFGKSPKVQYVICSRIEEYSRTTDAPVYCQIMIKPLTLIQIKKELSKNKTPESNGILYAIQKKPLFAKAIKTPFYLNTAQLLFSSLKSHEEFSFSSSTLDGLKREIIVAFIQEATRDFTNGSYAKTIKWLAFLAKEMNKKNLVTFELLDLQFDWVKLNKIESFIARTLKILVFGLASGLFFGLALGTIGLVSDNFFVRQHYTLYNLLVLVVCLTWIFIEGSFDKGIELNTVPTEKPGVTRVENLDEVRRFQHLKSLIITTKDITNLSWESFWGIFILSLFLGLAFGLISGIFYDLLLGWAGADWGGLILGVFLSVTAHLAFIIYGHKDGDNSVFTIDRESLQMLLFTSIFLSASLGSIFVLVYSFALALVEYELGGMLSCLFVCLAFALIGVVLGVLGQWRTSQSYIRISQPYQRFRASIKMLHFSILQHWYLRLILYYRGLFPMQLVQFLQEATTNHLLETDGGSWRFRHRILQDYFAEIWKEVRGND